MILQSIDFISVLVGFAIGCGITFYVSLFFVRRKNVDERDEKYYSQLQSKILEQQAAEEDNDLKAMGIMCKALREKRSEKFEDGWLEPLQRKYTVEKRNNGSFTITTIMFGKIDYYPKANKLLIRKANTWRKPGLQWIIKHLLEDEK